jgi:glycine/D-amino acid oxidase-like deaminating enzyme
MMPGLVLDPASEQSKLIGLKAVHKGIQGLNCGTLAPELLSKFYESELRKLGGEFQFGTVVKSLRLEPKNPLDLPGEPFAWQEKVFTGVETDRGFVAADTIVLAAGLETPFLLDAVGVDCLTKPKKRQVFRIRGEAVERLLAVKGFNDQNTMPFTFLPIGDIHFRPVLGERSFWVGAGDNLGRRFHLEKEATAEESFYTYSICPILSEYFPCFAGVRPASSWAGHYDVNSLDGTPVIQRLSNCILIAGMSGSGIMKADGIGRVAEAAFEGKSEAQLYDGSTIEVSRLGLTNRAVGKEKFVL